MSDTLGLRDARPPSPPRRRAERLQVQVTLEDDYDGLLETDNPDISLVANRAACAELSALFGKAAASEPGAFAAGSPESADLTRALNEPLVATGNARFQDFALDETLGDPAGPPVGWNRVKTEAGNWGCPLLAAIVGWLILRGAWASWHDLRQLW